MNSITWIGWIARYQLNAQLAKEQRAAWQPGGDEPRPLEEIAAELGYHVTADPSLWMDRRGHCVRIDPERREFICR